jgi:hypothetical protein
MCPIASACYEFDEVNQVDGWQEQEQHQQGRGYAAAPQLPANTSNSAARATARERTARAALHEASAGTASMPATRPAHQLASASRPLCGLPLQGLYDSQPQPASSSKRPRLLAPAAAAAPAQPPSAALALPAAAALASSPTALVAPGGAPAAAAGLVAEQQGGAAATLLQELLEGGACRPGSALKVPADMLQRVTVANAGKGPSYAAAKWQAVKARDAQPLKRLIHKAPNQQQVQQQPGEAASGPGKAPALPTLPALPAVQHVEPKAAAATPATEHLPALSAAPAATQAPAQPPPSAQGLDHDAHAAATARDWLPYVTPDAVAAIAVASRAAASQIDADNNSDYNHTQL